MKNIAVIVCLLVCAYVAGCGSYSGASTPTLSLTPSGTVSIDDGQTLSVTGSVSATWTLSGSGMLSSTTGTAITYTAPPTGTGSASISASASGYAAGPGLTVNFVLALNVTTTQLPAAQAAQNYNQTIAVTGGVTPYTFSISSGNLPSGLTLNPNSGVISGIPAQANQEFNFTVKITDSSAAGAETMMDPLNIVVNPNPPELTPTTLPTVAFNVPYNQTLTPVGGEAPYTIALDPQSGPLPSGLQLNGTTHSSANASITGTTTQSGTFPIIVDVTDSEATPVTTQATYSLEVTANSACGSGSEALLSGQYVFVFSGYDSESTSEPVAIGGSIALNGSGGITSGTVDLNTDSSGGTQTNALTAGSYSIGSDHRGCMSITTAAGTQNYRFSVGGINSSTGIASYAQAIESDANGPFVAGAMYQQNTASFANVGGNYAFGSSSIQNTALCVNPGAGQICGGKFGAAGVITLGAPAFTVNYSGTVTGGTEDFNLMGILNGGSATSWPATGISINGGGTYTIDATTGRGTMLFTAATSPSATTLNLIFYVVSQNQVLTLSTADQTTSELFTGQAQLQATNSFSIANMTANPSIVSDSSWNVGFLQGATEIAQLTASSNGAFNFSAVMNNGTVSQYIESGGAGAMTVTASGRVTATGSSSGGATQNYLIYLVNSNQGFLLEASSAVASGTIVPQTATALANSITPYSIGTINQPAPRPSNVLSGPAISGVASIPVNNGFPEISNMTLDQNGTGETAVGLTVGDLQFGINSSTGFALTPTTCALGGNGQIFAACELAFYVVSPTQVIMMEVAPFTEVRNTPVVLNVSQ